MTDQNGTVRSSEIDDARRAYDNAQGSGRFAPGVLLAGLLSEKGHYAEALAVLTAIQPLAESDFERAQVLQRQGWIHLRQSQYDKAYYFLGEAMVKLGTHPDSLELFHVYHDLAWMSYRQGYLEKARNYSEGAQLVVRSMPLKSGRKVEEAKADLCHLMALIEAASGDFDASLAHLESERQLRQAHDNPVKQASLFNKMSSVLQAKGQLRQAREFQLQAQELARRNGDDFRLAVSAKNLGEICFSLGDLDAADGHFQRASELSRAVGNQLGTIFAHAGTGRILEARGQFAKASEQFQEALKLARRIKSRELEYSLLVDLAELSVAWDRPEEAADQLEAAETLANELDMPVSPRHVLVTARRCWISGDGAEVARGRALLQELLSRPLVIDDEEPVSIPELEIQAGGLLARIQIARGDRAAAAATLRRAAGTVEAFVRDLDEADRNGILALPWVREVIALGAELGHPAGR
jgi:tetratricopeptide (TPR) repeat protein